MRERPDRRDAEAMVAGGSPASVPYVAVDGCIGAGKTTVTSLLSEALGFEPVCEKVSWNPFLVDMYRDPASHAVQAMVTFLCIHFHQLQIALQRKSAKGVVSDYLYRREALFSEVILRRQGRLSEYRLVNQVFRYFRARLPDPALVLYLRGRTDFLLDRIKTRDRAFEREISPDFIDQLNAEYEKFFKRYRRSPVITVDVEALDLLTRKEDVLALANAVTARLTQEDKVLEVRSQSLVFEVRRG